jgi:integrase
MKAWLDRKVWRVKVRVSPGPEGRESLALTPFSPEDEVGAQARAALLGELLEGLAAANQAEELCRDVARTLVQLPEGDELQAHVRFVRTKLCTGAYVRGDKTTTIQQFGEAWTSGKLAKQHPDHIKSKRSADQDERNLRLYIYPQIGDMPVSAVRMEHLQTVMTSLPAHLGASARRHVAQAMRRLMALAVYPCQLIERSPVPGGFLPRVPRTSFTFLYPEEEAALLRCTAVPLLRRLVYGVLAREGMRKEELAQLRHRDLDLRNGVLTLRDHKTADTTGVRVWRLGDDTRVVLSWWGDQHPGEPGALVFPGLTVSNLARQLRRDLALAGVTRTELFEGGGKQRKLRAHDLRATFVTLALASGRPEQWVTDRTGHTSSEMVARYRRGARVAAEVGLGWLSPMDRTLPELASADSDGPHPVREGEAEGGGDLSDIRQEEPGIVEDFVAEREGFEPSVPLQVHMISNHAPSTTRSPLPGILQATPELARKAWRREWDSNPRYPSGYT